MKKADLHVHSNVSDGARSPEQIIDYVESNTDIDKVYITDHNNIAGAKIALAYSLFKNYKIEVGIGSEISTQHCHMIGLDIKKNIKNKMSPQDTAKEILNQGGFPVIAHPFNPFQKGRHLNGKILVESMLSSNIPFAIEVNGSLNYMTLFYSRGRFFRKQAELSLANKKAINIAKEYNIPIVGGSDSHLRVVLGSAYTIYKEDLISDIKENTIQYGFNFPYRKQGIKYFIYHALFDSIPVPIKYKNNILKVFPSERK